MTINLANLVNSLLYSFIGIVVLGLGFYLWDRMTPYDLWKEIVEKQNKALAVVVGAVTLGISIIIASAVHGG